MLFTSEIKFLFTVNSLSSGQLSDYPITIIKKFLLTTNVLPPMTGVVGLSPGYSWEINP